MPRLNLSSPPPRTFRAPGLELAHPGRVARKLGDWSREATRYADMPAVSETRNRVRGLVTAS